MKNIFVQYFLWHFVDVPKEILAAWRNFLVFNFNYFSVPILFKTLLSYWRKYQYSYGRGFEPFRYFEAFVFNTFSRIIGALIRIVFIVIGIMTEILIFLAGIFLFLAWFLFPFFLLIMLFLGLFLVFYV